MKHPIKLIIKKNSTLKDGTAPIYLQYCFSAERRTLIQTGVFIPSRYWNKKSCRILDSMPGEFGQVDLLQKKISEKKMRAEDLLNYAVLKKFTNRGKFLKDNLHLSTDWKIEQLTEEAKNVNLYSNIDDFRESKRGFAKPNTVDTINQMKAHLLAFENFRKEPITLNSFDATFYEEFTRFLTYDILHLRKQKIIKGFKINTIVKTIKYIKTFLRDRMRKKIIPFMDLGDYKGAQEMVDSVYLSWKEISIIYHLDLPVNSKLLKCRDLFVLGCLTGLRFSDYSDIKPEELRDGMLHVTQKKTLSTVVVPLRPEAHKILVGKYNMNIPAISNCLFNLHIKEIAKLAGFDELIKITHKKGNSVVEEIRPKYNWVMSHTCRRSFCTNEFLAGTPVNLIMAISGHKTEKAFRRYIKADQVQKANMIKELWDKRPGL